MLIFFFIYLVHYY